MEEKRSVVNAVQPVEPSPYLDQCHTEGKPRRVRAMSLTVTEEITADASQPNARPLRARNLKRYNWRRLW